MKFNPAAQLLLYASYGDGRDPVATTTSWWEAPARYITPPLGIPLGSACDFSTPAKFNPRVFCHDAPEIASNKVQLYSGTFNWDLNWAQFTSVTGYEQSTVSQISDGDGSNLPMAVGSAWFLRQSQFSQEFRLASARRCAGWPASSTSTPTTSRASSTRTWASTTPSRSRALSMSSIS